MKNKHASKWFATILPVEYRTRLADASMRKDSAAIDLITDELADIGICRHRDEFRAEFRVKR